ncbi:MAG: amidohydrolase family protein [Desulfobulbales bacterium]|nr:amidohydrolase family protein [Desulfobulbales bacterium]
MTGGAYLHKASYLVPVSGDHDLPPVIKDGAVLTRNGRIVAVAPYRELRGSDAIEVDHGAAVLMPALVNCHSHLELSYLARLGQNDGRESGEMTDWIRKLLTEREKGCDPEEIEMAAWQGLARLYAGGCRAGLDIGNLPESREFGRGFKVDLRFFQELLGLTETGIEAGLSLLAAAENDPDLLFTAHSPYSTGPELIRKLKERAARHGHLFPIHVAESSAETAFLAAGTGPFRDFLEERNAWDDSFVSPGLSPIAYLDRLGVLDEHTLCVHCVHCDGDDLEVVAARNSAICVCPGSNRYLEVGRAPVPHMLAKGIRVVLGTDSSASNPHLSLWQEMRVLHEEHPGIEPGEIIRMAGRNGAELMGISDEIGSLEPGCSSCFLAVSGDLPEKANPEAILEWLVSAGLSIVTEWVE